MRIIFAGTPEFARIALERLHAAGHTIALVLTQPDRPAGRGMKLQASSVKQFAQEHGIAVAQPRSLRLDGKYPDDARAARQAMADAQADVMVVAAYGLILPQWVLEAMAAPVEACAPMPVAPCPPSAARTPPLPAQQAWAHRPSEAKFGCLNIHGSLLPRWRGAAPIHRAIEAGDLETGVTIMQMDAGLDTGDMLLRQALPIVPTDTTATLHDRVAELGATLIVQALELASQGRLHPTPQPAEGVTYAHKIEKHEAAIDWKQDATAIVRRVRAFNPFPGASTVLHADTIKVWAAQACAAAPTAPPGQIVALAPEYIDVAAINSIVRLTELQRPGGKRLSAGDFLRGCPLQLGMAFGQADAPAAAAPAQP